AYRQLRTGVNIEEEIGRFLTEVAHFGNSVPVLGTMEHVADDGSRVSLAVLQSWVQNQGDGWTNTLDYLDRYLESVRLAGRAEGEAQPAAESPHGGYLELVRMLGKRTGELHLALATPSGDPNFEPEPITADDIRRWTGRVRGELDETLTLLEE